jgi:hypothetical protein
MSVWPSEVRLNLGDPPHAAHAFDAFQQFSDF